MSHAILNPSSSHRWLHCVGSVAACIGRESESSEFADEGTAAHQLATWALREGKSTASYLGQSIPVLNDDGTHRRTFKADDEMTDYVQVYVDSIRDKLLPSTMLLVEQRVDSGLESKLYGKVDGTVDACLIQPEEKLVDVNDLKYGRGVRVEAKDNSQLRLYALGAVDAAEMLGYDMHDWKVRMVIHQPRLDHISDDALTVAELRAWREHARATIGRIDAGDTSRVPTEEGCRFCPIKAECPALAKFATDAVCVEFKDVPDLTSWGLGKALDKLELVEQWAEAVRKAALAELDAGRSVDGWKLVEGRAGNRTWVDETAVAGTLEAMKVPTNLLYKTTFVTPTAAEKALKALPKAWAAVQDLIFRGPPGKALAKDTDPRPSAGGSVLDSFK